VLDNLDDFNGVEKLTYRFMRKSITGKGYVGPDKDLMDDLLSLEAARPDKVRIEVYLPSSPPTP
jgi:hypothetical protein